MEILFVCTGNTCRSCMAEVIFNNLCSICDVAASSAGISVNPNSITSKNSALVVRDFLHMDISERKAMAITKTLLDNADLVLTMTNNHKKLLISYMPELLQSDKLYTLSEYVGEACDIIDPFGGDLEVYKATYEQLHINIKALLQKLKGGIKK